MCDRTVVMREVVIHTVLSKRTMPNNSTTSATHVVFVCFSIGGFDGALLEFFSPSVHIIILIKEFLHFISRKGTEYIFTKLEQ